MRTIITAVLAVFFPFTAAAATFVFNNCVEGNGKAKTETRDLSGFEVVDTSGVFDIEINASAPGFKVRVTADENILPHINTTIQGNRLMVFSTRAICPEIEPRIDIEMPVLEAIVSSGTDDIKASAVNSRNLNLIVDGSGDVHLDGRAASFDATLSGSGTIDATHLKTVQSSISISGSGDATVNAEKFLKVDITGVGDVSYLGHPRIEQNITGVGDVSPLE